MYVYVCTCLDGFCTHLSCQICTNELTVHQITVIGLPVAINNMLPTYLFVCSADVLVEFDPVDYIVTEGEEVMFRIVKRTNSTREVTVTVVFDAGNNLTNGTYGIYL